MERTVGPEEDLTLAIVEAVADATGRPPEALRPFAESIDADAVAALFDRAAADGAERLELTYEGCRVAVDPGIVTVDPIAAEGPTSDVPDERETAHVGVD